MFKNLITKGGKLMSAQKPALMQFNRAFASAAFAK